MPRNVDSFVLNVSPRPCVIYSSLPPRWNPAWSSQSVASQACHILAKIAQYIPLYFFKPEESMPLGLWAQYICVSKVPPVPHFALGLDLVRLASLKWSTLFSSGPAVLTLRFTSPEPLWDYTSQPRRHTSFSYSNRSQTSLAESLYNLIGDEVEKRSRRWVEGEVGAVEPSPIAKGIKLILPAWGLYGWLNGRELTVEVEK